MATGDKRPVVMSADRAAAYGIATLGADAKLSDSQIPIQKIMSVTNAAEYSSTQTYALGAYCTRDGKLYKANQAISAAETWTAAHWTETSVTAELIAIYTALQKKAPAGFGLGSVATYLTEADDLNTIGKGGWYWWVNSIPKNAPNISSCTMRVDPGEQETGNYATQTIYYIGQNKGAKLRRYNVDGTWQPFEWENPPMWLGDEYRTTERYQGKPVYVRVVDFGALPNNTTKQINFDGSGTIKPIRCSGYAHVPAPDDDRYETLNSGIFPTSAKYSTCVWYTALGLNNQAGVWVRTDYDASGRNAYFVVHYIKTTD